MPASTLRPASHSQLNFLRTLAAERTGNPLADALNARIATGEPLTSREASAHITTLMAVRRAAAPTADAGAVDMPAPTDDNRAGRMLAAGSIEATVTLNDGRHVTVGIRTRTRSGRGWTNAALGEDGSRTTITVSGTGKVGWVNRHGDQYRLTLRTRRPEYVTAINAVLAYAAGATVLDGVLRVQEASRCGRCFRSLTDPVSIDRGIGPECYGRGTGSRHVAPVADALERAGTSAAEVNAEQRRQTAAAETHQTLLRGQHQALTALAAAAEAPAPAAAPAVSPDAKMRARDLISEALDSYCSDADRDYAMRIFDQLAR